MQILSDWTLAREDGTFCVRHGQYGLPFPPCSNRRHINTDGISSQPWLTAGLVGWLDERRPSLLDPRSDESAS